MEDGLTGKEASHLRFEIRDRLTATLVPFASFGKGSYSRQGERVTDRALQIFDGWVPFIQRCHTLMDFKMDRVRLDSS